MAEILQIPCCKSSLSLKLLIADIAAFTCTGLHVGEGKKEVHAVQRFVWKGCCCAAACRSRCAWVCVHFLKKETF